MLIERRTQLTSQAALQLAAFLVAVSLSGCGASGYKVTKVTAQMSAKPETIKVGVPEGLFKEAIYTFYLDPNPAASLQGRTQYLSRIKDADAPLYIAQCKDGKCIGLQIYYQNHPAAAEAVQKAMQSMLPAICPPQSKVSDKEMKAGKGVNEFHYFGSFLTGVIGYTDKSKAQAQSIAVFFKPGEEVEAAYAGKHTDSAIDKPGG